MFDRVIPFPRKVPTKGDASPRLPGYLKSNQIVSGNLTPISSMGIFLGSSRLGPFHDTFSVITSVLDKIASGEGGEWGMKFPAH